MSPTYTSAGVATDGLAKTTNISWPAVHAQFGTGFKAVRQFEPRFTEALQAALAAYPEARVDLGVHGDHVAPIPAADCRACLKAGHHSPHSCEGVLFHLTREKPPGLGREAATRNRA